MFTYNNSVNVHISRITLVSIISNCYGIMFQWIIINYVEVAIKYHISSNVNTYRFNCIELDIK